MVCESPEGRLGRATGEERATVVCERRRRTLGQPAGVAVLALAPVDGRAECGEADAAKGWLEGKEAVAKAAAETAEETEELSWKEKLNVVERLEKAAITFDYAQNTFNKIRDE